MAKGAFQMTAVDTAGNVLEWPFTVTVRREVPGAPLARLYDADDNPLSNPLTITGSEGWAKGFFRFHTTGGFYRIDVAKGSTQAEPLRHVGIGTYGGADQGVINDPGYFFEFEEEITEPPSLGFFRANNADLSLATELYVSKTTRGGYDVGARLLELDPGGDTVKDAIHLRGVELTGASWRVDSADDDTDYVTLHVSGHDGSTEFVTDVYALQREIAGGDGASGASGGGLKGVAIDVVDTEGGDPDADYEAGDTIDGVTLVAGMIVGRFTAGGDADDGLRVVQSSGTAPRHPDFDTWDKCAGALFPVMRGDTYADTLWRCTSDPGGGTIDTDPLVFEEFVGGDGQGGFATKALAEAYAPVTAPDFIRIEGYAAAGDGGGALYKKAASEPAHEGKFSITLADAVTVVWYELAPENPGEVSVLQFGANGDGSTDDLFAFDDARDFLIEKFGGGTIRVPHTADGYALSDTFINDGGPIRLLGETNAVQPGMGTMILVAATKTGINLKNGSLGRGAFSTVENIRLVGSDTEAGSNDGLLMQANSGRIINVTAEGFGGYGVHILSALSIPDVSINVNHWYAEKVRCYLNFTGGWAVEGVDSNAGTGVALDSANNGGWQFYENSLIGNTYIGPHSACGAEADGDWLFGDINRFVRILGGYSEDAVGKIGIRIEAGGAGGHYLDFGNLNNTIEDLSGTTSTVINWSAGGMSYNRLRVGTATEVRGVWNENGIQLSDGAFFYGTRADNAAMVINRTGSDGEVAVWQKAGATVGSVSVTAAATTYNTSSDYRLKDNIRDLLGSGAFIDALQPRQWEWTVDGSPGAGFVAHEAQTVTPSSVTGEKDAVAEDGTPVYQGMMPGSSEIVANLVAEVQDLRRRLARLESS